ncbi:hypothetical protein ACJX0J_027436, partial [Zea mays]
GIKLKNSAYIDMVQVTELLFHLFSSLNTGTFFTTLFQYNYSIGFLYVFEHNFCVICVGFIFNVWFL